jgi:hypothetical protein
MLGWILQIIFFSVVLILTIHCIITYLKTTLTVPKVINYIDSKKYDDINKIIEFSFESHENINTTNNIDINIMKNELKNFFKYQFDESIN